MERVPRIAVIGAGVSGLSTVWCLKRHLPQAGLTRFAVTIYADKVLEETLSIGAGGFFRVDPHIGVSRSKNQEWARIAFNHFRDIAASEEADDAGVKFVKGIYVSSRSDFSLECMSEFCPDLRALTLRQLGQVPPGNKFRYGYEYTTIISSPRRYLKRLHHDAVSTCDLVIRTIDSLEERTFDGFDVVVNCTGLGARHLAQDDSLTAIRGQTIRVHAPSIRTFTWADDAYVFPMGDGSVTLGGIKQMDREDMDVDNEDKEWIWKKCTEVVPDLKGCRVEQDWVGLRPFRQPIRVQKQVLASGRVIVHNYGHGANGYTYSMGTAMEATRLVIQSLLPDSQSAREETNS